MMKLNSTELQNQIQLGKDFSQAKDYKKAEQVFLKILKQHELADVYNALGMTYADTGNFTAAEFCFQKALKINPQYMEAALNLSVLYNNLGMSKKSKDIYKRLDRYGQSGRGAMDPLLMSRIANLYADIGDLYHGVGEYREAIQAYQAAVELCPKYIDIQTKLAVAYREAGKKSKALEIFEKYKRKASKYAPFWIALGVTYYASNQSTEAKKAWKKALSIDPNNRIAKAYTNLPLKASSTAKKSQKKTKKKSKKTAKKKKK